MNTMVSAYGPLVMNVFEPFSTYSSPSRRAVACIEPNASLPELGSVIAHAPILSSVSRSSAHRSFCAVVPLDMIAVAVSPTDTPSAVTMPGEHLHSSMIGSSVIPPDPRDPWSRSPSLAAAGAAPAPFAASFSASIRRLKESRAIASIPNVVYSFRRRSYGGQVAVLELFPVRADLVVDELTHGVADHLQLFGPFVHDENRNGVELHGQTTAMFTSCRRRRGVPAV